MLNSTYFSLNISLKQKKYVCKQSHIQLNLFFKLFQAGRYFNHFTMQPCTGVTSVQTKTLYYYYEINNS